jgi:hypothetical protein
MYVTYIFIPCDWNAKQNHSTKMDNKFFEGMAKFRCLMEYKWKIPQFFPFVEEIITQSHRMLRITNSWIKYH